jgi:hypothetical protein
LIDATAAERNLPGKRLKARVGRTMSRSAPTRPNALRLKKSPASLRGTLLISAELSGRKAARTRRVDPPPRSGGG